jgi:hypothetical protein
MTFQESAIRALVAGASLVAAAACSSMGTAGPDADAVTRYEAAVRDAAVASPDKIRPLAKVPAAGTVRVARWVTDAQLACKDSQPPCALPKTGQYTYWVSLEAEIGPKCRAWHLGEPALSRRLEQLLGMPLDPPAQYRKTHFLVIQVNATDLQRACLGVAQTATGDAPVCTLRAPSNSQSGGPVVDGGFVGDQMAGSYVLGDAVPGYPFTRLGYTYDWNRESTDHYGVSEFLLKPQADATVVEQVGTAQFCGAP